MVVKLGTLCLFIESGVPPRPKPSLGKKDQVRKKSTPRVTSVWYKVCL